MIPRLIEFKNFYGPSVSLRLEQKFLDLLDPLFKSILIIERSETVLMDSEPQVAQTIGFKQRLIEVGLRLFKKLALQ